MNSHGHTPDTGEDAVNFTRHFAGTLGQGLRLAGYGGPTEPEALVPLVDPQLAALCAMADLTVAPAAGLADSVPVAAGAHALIDAALTRIQDPLAAAAVRAADTALVALVTELYARLGVHIELGVVRHSEDLP